MTLADLWKYIKGDTILLIETNGANIPAYETHKYMNRLVQRITSIDNATYIYLST